MTDNPLQICNSTAELLIFTAQAGEQGIEVRFEDETVWPTQSMMAELFRASVPAVSQHLKGFFESQELERGSVLKRSLTTAATTVQGCWPEGPLACVLPTGWEPR